MVPRVMVFSHEDEFLFEVPPADIFGLVRTEQVNREHSLEITTSAVLEKEQRILMKDGTGKFREFVVAKEDAEHSSGKSPIGTYWCPWSLMYDLSRTYVTGMPGTTTACTAADALDAAIEGTSRWERGTVTQTSTGGASMYYQTGYEALGTVVENWGGEIDAEIVVSSLYNVTGRYVELHDKLGEQDARRRFDWSRDMAGIRRTVAETPVCCRVLPRGKGEEMESGGYGRKITIEDANDGVPYLEDAEAVPLVRVKTSNGYEHPIALIENGDIDDPAELKAWAQSVMTQYTRPKVTYEASVIQLAQAGMSPEGIALGDAVQCVDRGFSDKGLRIEGRITEIVVNELDPTDVKVTIGDAREGIADGLASLASVTAAVKGMNGGSLSTAKYLDNLLKRLNAEVNATGGWTYIVPGHGMRTYSCAVSDPLVGQEAKDAVGTPTGGSVVEIVGGTIRIANSLTSGGEWDWRTVIQSGLLVADTVVSAAITSGFIGSASGDCMLDLDNHVMRLGSASSGHLSIDSGAVVIADGSEQISHIGMAEYLLNNYPYFTFGRGLERYVNGFAIGQYNTSTPDILFSTAALRFAVGNGSSASSRSNAFEVDSNGNVGFKGSLTSPNFGVYVSGTFSSVSVDTNSRTNLKSISLPVDKGVYSNGAWHYGIWVVTAKVSLSGYSSSSGSTDRFEVYLASSSSGTGFATQEGVIGRCTVSYIYKNTGNAAKTIYVAAEAKQVTSGTSYTASGEIVAVRIA